MSSKLLTEVKDLPASPEKNPAINTGISVTGVTGFVSLLLVFFPHLLNDKQTTAIYTIAAIVLPIITALLTRGKVWSPASVVAVVNEAEKAAYEEAKKLNQIKTIKPVTEI